MMSIVSTILFALSFIIAMCSVLLPIFSPFIMKCKHRGVAPGTYCARCGEYIPLPGESAFVWNIQCFDGHLYRGKKGKTRFTKDEATRLSKKLLMKNIHCSTCGTPVFQKVREITPAVEALPTTVESVWQSRGLPMDAATTPSSIGRPISLNTESLYTTGGGFLAQNSVAILRPPLTQSTVGEWDRLADEISSVETRRVDMEMDSLLHSNLLYGPPLPLSMDDIHRMTGGVSRNFTGEVYSFTTERNNKIPLPEERIPGRLEVVVEECWGDGNEDSPSGSAELSQDNDSGTAQDQPKDEEIQC